MDRYDTEQFNPPAPIVTVKVSKPYSETYEESKGKIDTGADMTVIPNDWIERLGLIPARHVQVTGYSGEPCEEIPTYYVSLSFKKYKYNFDLMEVISTNRKNVLIGRDILNTFKLLLDGKNLIFEITDS